MPPRRSTGAAPEHARPPSVALERRRLRLEDGAATTLHVARFDRASHALRVRALEPVASVRRWCQDHGSSHAIVGGFYLRPGGPALGDLWVDGVAQDSEPFDRRWHERRACLHVEGARVRLAPRSALGRVPGGDLLHAGPMLVAGGRSLIRDGLDVEGFSAGAHQFDSDITRGRYPRSALGLSGSQHIAVVCEGRADDEAGLTLAELAQAMVEVGADEAINLDGGGSTSLVVGGALVNTPREEHGLPLLDGRPVATLVEFAPRPT